MSVISPTVRHGGGIEAAKNLIIWQENPLACSKAGVLMENCLRITSLRMGGFMGLAERIYVLNSKMKLYYIGLSRLSIMVFFVTVVAAADETLPYYKSTEFTPHWIKPGSHELIDFHQILPFSFTDQEGDKITGESFENEIYVANFFFSSCPGICPSMRSKLSKVQEKFIDDVDVRILSHSIRPTSDTVSVLKDYAERHNIVSGKWHLVTGEKDKIYKLAKSAYFAHEDLGNIENTNDFLHTENLILIDKDRHIRGVYNGLNKASVNYLIADIDVLKSEAKAQPMPE